MGFVWRARDLRGRCRRTHPAPLRRPDPGARPAADPAAAAGGAWPVRRLLAAILLGLCLMTPAVHAATSPDEILADPVLEQRARALAKQLRCLVCQNQSIDDSDADLARDLRRIVREQLVAGRSDGEIMGYVVARYGEFVLLKPRF